MTKGKEYPEQEKLSLDDVIRAVLANPQQAAQLDRGIAQRADDYLTNKFLDDYVQRGHHYPEKLMKFRKTAGTTPIVNSDIRRKTQEAYCCLMGKKIKSLSEPRAYDGFISDAMEAEFIRRDISTVQEATSLNPVYKGKLRNLVQRVYGTLLRIGHYIDFIALKRMVKVKPELTQGTMNIFQRTLAKWFMGRMITPIFTEGWDVGTLDCGQSSVYDVRFSELAKGYEFIMRETGVKLVFSRKQKERIEKAQEELFEHCYMSPFLIIGDMTGINRVTPRFVQEVYLRKMTEVGAGEVAGSYTKKGFVRELRELQRVSGIKPTKNKEYREAAQQNHFRLLREETLMEGVIIGQGLLRDVFGVPVVKDQEYLEAVQDRYINLLTILRYYPSPENIEEFRRWVRIDPVTDERFEATIKEAALKWEGSLSYHYSYDLLPYVRDQFGLTIKFTDKKEQRRIRDTYRRIVEHAKFEYPKDVRLRLKRIEEIVEYGGVKPRFSADQRAKYDRMRQMPSVNLATLTSDKVGS